MWVGFKNLMLSVMMRKKEIYNIMSLYKVIYVYKIVLLVFNRDIWVLKDIYLIY